MNQAADAGHVFGRDIVFTYGPLAFLMVPLDIASNLIVANVFRLVIQVIFIVAIAGLFVEERRLPALLTFAALLMGGRQLGLSIEGYLLLIVGLLTLIGVFFDRRTPVAIAASLAAILIMVKMSLGVASLAILVVGAVVARFLFDRSSRLAVGLIPFPIVCCSLAVLLFDSPSSFFQWLRLSMQVVSGYSVANSITTAASGPPVQVTVGFITVLAWIGVLRLVRRDQRLLACHLVFAPVVLIQFRLAFVRQDNHQLLFVPFMIALVAITVLFARQPRQLAAYIGACAALLVAGSLTNLVDPISRGLLTKSFLIGGSGPRALSQLLHITDTRAALAAESAINLEPLRLNDEVREALEGSQNGVGTLPWEIQYCPANGLEWNPTPTLQFYSAYTRELDLWSAEHYAGDNAPQFIINAFSAVGMRRQLFDVPATWRTIFLNYEVRSAGTKPEPTLLLERRQKPLQTTFDEISRASIVPGGAAIPVPDSDHLIFADLDLRLNVFGQLRKSLFRVPAVVLVMTHQSRHVSICRLIPGNTRNAILVNRFPRDFRGYRLLWQKITDDPVVRVAIAGDGAYSFRSRTPVIWRELRILSPTQSSVEAPRPESPSEPNRAAPESG